MLPDYTRQSCSIAPQQQGSPEVPYVKVAVTEGTPEQRLEQALDDFVKKGQPPLFEA